MKKSALWAVRETVIPYGTNTRTVYSVVEHRGQFKPVGPDPTTDKKLLKGVADELQKKANDQLLARA